MVSRRCFNNADTCLYLGRIPRNVEFVQMDIELPWQSMGRDSWDVIHMRTLIGSIYNWRMLYDQVIE